MNDCIDRQTIINLLTSRAETLRGLYGDLGGAASGVRKLIQTLPSVEPEQKWIPVTERLPKKENKSYWVCTDTKHQYECRWTNNIYGIGESNDWGWKIFDIPQYTKVLAWMPLPEPWRGEE